jgi:hypothetical protein
MDFQFGKIGGGYLAFRFDDVQYQREPGTPSRHDDTDLAEYRSGQPADCR